MGDRDRAELGKVIIVNTTDAGGGAERISMALLDGFEELGTETWLAVGGKLTDHERVICFHSSPHVDYTLEHTRYREAKVAVRTRVDRALGLENFNFPYSRFVAEIAGAEPDLVLCNNLHGGFFDLRQLPGLSRRLPVVLRLADSWTFTGHCAVPPGCERWRTGCGRCPDLAIPPAIERDATRINWHRKRRIFARSRVYLVAPSRWLLERARQSLLAPAIVDARVIPNGVDLDRFSADGAIPVRERTLLFAANGGAANPYKDFASIRAALELVEPPLELVVVGGDKRSEELADGIRIRHLPFQSPEELASLYRSTYAYVHAAPQESFCLTAAEALACGTPVVAAAGGGIAEVVRSGRTGWVVPPGDIAGLADALRRLLADPALRERMGNEAAADARRRFDSRRMVGELHGWCSEVLAREQAPAS